MSLLIRLLPFILAPVVAAASPSRVFEFTYEVLPGDYPAGKSVDLYIPLPSNQVGQRIAVENLQTSLPAEEGRETRHGNRYLRLHRPAGSSQPLAARLSWIISRDAVDSRENDPITEAERQRYLGPNRLVPVGHDVLQPILGEVHHKRADGSAEATARAIYDWVVDNVEYKKVGTGWGNGDTFWACNERYGNCTDFHALFISLARSEGIPARFEIGFPVPEGESEGMIGGYHCWVQFYLPGRGWIPIDASEAAKHPEMREYLYGNQPADRVLFTVGRDLVLSDASADRPLNYFIYPYVEVDGQPWDGRVESRFSFREQASRQNAP